MRISDWSSDVCSSDLALDAHLHSTAHAWPVEHQRGAIVGLQFAALAPVEVGVEHEALLVVRLEQHRARRGAGSVRDGGHDHRGAVGLAGGQGFVEQRVERCQGFAAQRVWRIHWAIVARCPPVRSEEHTSELQSLMRISYAVFCLKKKT